MFAQPMEAAGLQRVLEGSGVPSQTSGQLTTWFAKDIDLIVTVGGIGRKRTVSATLDLVEQGPRLVIAAGFSAGLDREANVGDVVVARRVIPQEDPNDPVFCSSSAVGSLPPSGAFGFPIRLCDFLTVDFPALSAEQKRVLHDEFGAAALDMESYAAGDVCRDAGVPFIAIRSITDRVDQDLPEVVTRLMIEERPLRRMMMVLARPGAWGSLSRLRASARLASDHLGDVLAMMLLRMA